jgi:hypothetical protein
MCCARVSCTGPGSTRSILLHREDDDCRSDGASTPRRAPTPRTPEPATTAVGDLRSVSNNLGSVTLEPGTPERRIAPADNLRRLAEPALVDDFPEPAMPEPATTMGDLRADDPEPASKRDFLGSVTLEPGTPELRNAGDAPSDNVRRLATGEGLECGRFPEELNGAIGCLPEADEELVPRLMPMPPTRIARNITQVPRGKAFRAMYFEPAKHYGHTSSLCPTIVTSNVVKDVDARNTRDQLHRITRVQTRCVQL